MLAEKTPIGSSNSESMAEMKKLVEEYKLKASNSENKARWNETQIAELRIEYEVALKRATIAEN